MNLLDMLLGRNRAARAKVVPTAAQPMAMVVLNGDDDTSDTADVLLYGYIGEDWWSEEASNTGNGFAKLLSGMSKTKKRVNIRINSLGGSVYDGNAIVSSIRACEKAGCEVHTYNDGIAASMAAVIWAAGSHRHAATNSMLMLHAASNIVWGNARDMRKEADILDKYDTTLRAVLAETLGGAAADYDAYFDGEDHWLNHAEVSDLGWLSDEAAGYAAAVAPPEAATKKGNYAALLAEYMGNRGVAARAITPEPRELNPIVNAKIEEVNIDSIKAALASGEVTAEQLRDIVGEPEVAPAVAPEVEAEEEDEAADIAGVQALQAELATMRSNLAAADARVAALGGGATRTPAAAPLPVAATAVDEKLAAAAAELNRALDRRLA